MVDCLTGDQGQQWDQGQQSAEEQQAAEEHTWQGTAAKSFEDIKKEIWEHPAEPCVRQCHQDLESSIDLWREMILTFLCAAAVATFSSYDGNSVERALWSFVFAMTLAMLVYTGGLVTLLFDGLSSYRWTVIAITLSILLPMRAVSRNLFPEWWPIQ